MKPDDFVLRHSYEDEKTWTHNVQSHIWIYDFHDETLTEIATENRPAPFMVCPIILPGDERIAASPIIDGEQRIFTMNLDGTDQQKVTHQGDGFAYGGNAESRWHQAGISYHTLSHLDS